MTEAIDIDELIAEHARCWQAVGWSQSSPLYDPGLPHRKQEALEATKALKDVFDKLSHQPNGES